MKTMKHIKDVQRKERTEASKWPGGGHVDYSGFGIHGKIGKARNKSQRKQNRSEAKNALRGVW